MNMETLARALAAGWGRENLRPLKNALLEQVQAAIGQFKPIVPEDYSRNPIQLLDFFCGAGGTSLGFAALNSVLPAVKFLGGCDINTISAQTYSRNYGTPLLNDDVISLANDEGKLDALLARVGYDMEKPLIMIGCAPCQGFSSHRKKDWDEEDDVRNSLVIAFAKIVEHVQPDVIIMENVPEFLSKRYWKYFSEARRRFEENGYTVKQNIFNAASFGVPQERFRTVIIGMKKDFLLPRGYLESKDYRTVRDAIGNLPPLKAGEASADDSLHKSTTHKQSTLEVIRQVPHDGGSRPTGVGPACLEKINGFSDVYGRLFWDRPSITITHYARNPASGRYTHPEQDRGLTAREAAALQSFPRGFEFTGKSDDIYRQIGEAVPPLLAAGIATDVIIELLSSPPVSPDGSPASIVEPVSSSYSSVIAGIKTKTKGAK
jgi:DNA (cytosine-5)-methyltransferase 1